MVVQLTVGADMETVLEVLREVGSDAYNARGAGGTPAARVDAYLKWANRAALRLRNQVTPAEIDRLVLTPVYFAVVALTREPTAHIGELVDRELDDRVT